MSIQLANSTFSSTNQAYSILAQATTRNSVSEVLKLELRSAASQFIDRFGPTPDLQ